MSKIRYSHCIFPHGVISKEAQANVNMEGYADSLQECINFKSKIVGGLEKRIGTQMSRELRASIDAKNVLDFILIPFVVDGKRYEIEIVKRIKNIRWRPGHIDTPVFTSYIYDISNHDNSFVFDLVENAGPVGQDNLVSKIFYVEKLSNLKYLRDANTLILFGDSDPWTITYRKRADKIIFNSVGIKYSFPPMGPGINLDILPSFLYNYDNNHNYTAGLKQVINEDYFKFEYTADVTTNLEFVPDYESASAVGYENNWEDFTPSFYTGIDRIDSILPNFGDVGNWVSLSYYSPEKQDYEAWFGKLVCVLPQDQYPFSNQMKDYWVDMKVNTPTGWYNIDANKYQGDGFWKIAVSPIMKIDVSRSPKQSTDPTKVQPIPGSTTIHLPSETNFYTIASAEKCYSWRIGAINQRCPIADKLLMLPGENKNLAYLNRGQPKCYCIFQNAFWIANTRLLPNYIWRNATAKNDWFDFTPGVKDGDSVYIKLSSPTGAEIKWIAGSTKLFAGTEDGIFSTGISNINNEPITPSNVAFNIISSIAASDLQPIQCLDALFFSDASQCRIFEIVLNDSGQYRVNDISLLAKDILVSQVKNHSYMGLVSRTYFVLCKDNSFAACVYQKNNDILAWNQLKIKESNERPIEIFYPNTLKDSEKETLCMAVKRKDKDNNIKIFLEYIEEKIKYDTVSGMNDVYLDFSKKFSFPLSVISITTPTVSKIEFDDQIEEPEEGQLTTGFLLTLQTQNNIAIPEVKGYRVVLDNEVAPPDPPDDQVWTYDITYQKENKKEYALIKSNIEDQPQFFKPFEGTVTFFYLNFGHLYEMRIQIENDVPDLDGFWAIVNFPVGTTIWYGSRPDGTIVHDNGSFLIDEQPLDGNKTEEPSYHIFYVKKIQNLPTTYHLRLNDQWQEGDNNYLYIKSPDGVPSPLTTTIYQAINPEKIEAVQPLKITVNYDKAFKDFYDNDNYHKNEDRKLFVRNIKEVESIYGKPLENFWMNVTNPTPLKEQDDTIILSVLPDDGEVIMDGNEEENATIQTLSETFVYPGISILWDLDYLTLEDEDNLSVCGDGGTLLDTGEVELLEADSDISTAHVIIPAGVAHDGYVSSAIIGLPYESTFTTVPMYIQSPSIGATAGLKSFESSVTLDLYKSSGGECGRSKDNLTKITYDNPNLVVDNPTPSYTGLIKHSFGGQSLSESEAPCVTITHREGCYFCIRSITQEVNVEDGYQNTNR